jgi:signal transduction histidine kinase
MWRMPGETNDARVAELREADAVFRADEERRLEHRARWSFGFLAVVFPLFHVVDHLVGVGAWAGLSLRLALASLSLAALAVSFTAVGRRWLHTLTVVVSILSVAAFGGLEAVRLGSGAEAGHLAPVAFLLGACFMIPWSARTALGVGLVSALLYGVIVLAFAPDPVAVVVPIGVIASVALAGPLISGLDRRARQEASLALVRLAIAQREAEQRKAATSRLEEAERSVVDRELRMATIGRRTSEIAHDMRNLLSLVMMYGDLARQAAQARDDEEQRADIDTMVGAAQRAAQSMQEVVDYARGARTVMLEPLDLVGVIEEVAGWLRPRIEPIGVAVLVAGPDDRSAVNLTADRAQITRVFENLLHNALDALATHSGPRRVEVFVAREGAEVVVTLDDSGPGISADVVGQLFQPFARGRAGGTGLGLATVRHLVDLHGGRVSAEARGPLGGARFVVRLPVG